MSHLWQANRSRRGGIGHCPFKEAAKRTDAERKRDSAQPYLTDLDGGPDTKK